MGKKPNATKQKGAEEDKRPRVAIVQADRCKPSKCRQECARHCPVNAQGKFCVNVTKQSRTAIIAEGLCTGCNICTKKCPFNAIRIINLPSNLTKDVTHCYGPNGFKLHRLPLPRPGRVLGLLGTNGIGKSTALAILAGNLKPNLGDHSEPPDWKGIVTHFRGNALQPYFERLLEDNLKAVLKPQHLGALQSACSEHDRVGDVLRKMDDKGVCAHVAQQLDITRLMDREVAKLSGGELQRMAIAALCVQKGDLYLVDEPSAYLDIRQRVRAADVIRSALQDTNYVVVVEHDLAVLDYLSDQVCCLWGDAGAYGAVTAPFGAREGINNFLAGWIPTENLRIREEALTFRIAENLDGDAAERLHVTEYPPLTKTMPGTLGDESGFQLDVCAGSFANSEIVVLLGENGTGKTTFIRMLYDAVAADISISIKPQMFSPKFQGTVRELLLAKINSSYLDPQFKSDVVGPMLIEQIQDVHVKNLSGGELQRVALVLALGKPADVYLIDEPSAYLDVEQRIAAARVVRRFILHQQKAAFVVEHDFIMATYLADRVVVFDGQPGVCCHASPPMPLEQGMNQFLAQLGITVRRDLRNGRPRINKIGGARDQEQKRAGNYFFLDLEC